MAEDTLKEALEALTATTKAGRLRELLPMIEAKVAAGVKHDEILEAINSHGFDLNKHAYKTYLYRFRKSAKKAVKDGKAPFPSPSLSGSAKAAAVPVSESAAVPPVAGVERTPEQVKAVLNQKIDLKQFKNKDD